MKDCLTRSAIRVEQRTVAGLRKPALLCDERGAADELADNLIVFGPDVIERRDVPLRHDQDVRRRLRVDVVERENAIVLVDDARGYLPLDDFAEQAVGHGA